MMKRALKIFGWAIVVYAIVGAVVLPPVLKTELPKILQQNLDGKLSIEDVSFNPFAFELTLDGVKLTQNTTNRTVAAFAKLVLNIDPTSSLFGKIDIYRFLLQNPYIYIKRNKNGSFNILELAKNQSKKPKTKKKEKTALARICIEEFKIEDAKAVFVDDTRIKPYTITFSSIFFNLLDIDTYAKKEAGKAAFYARFGIDGHIELNTRFDSLFPLKTQGDFTIAANQLYEEWRYVRDALNLEVADGRVSVNGGFSYDENDLRKNSLRFDNIELKNLRIKPKNGTKDVFTLKKFQILNTHVEPFFNRVDIAKVKFEGMQLKAKRNPKGEIDWQEYLKTSFETSNKHPKKANSKPWRVVLNDVELEKGGVYLKDEVPKKSVQLALEQIQIKIKGFDTKKGSRFSVNSAMHINKKGRFGAKAQVWHSPLKLDAKLDAADLPLEGFSSYLEELSYLVLKEGALGFQTDITFDQRKKELQVAGDVELKEFALARNSDGLHIFQIADMKVNDFVVQTPQNRAYVNKVDVDGLYVDAFIDRNKTLNFAKVLKTQPKKKHAKQEKAQSEKKPFAYQIAMIDIKNSNALFADYSLPIPFKTEIHELQGGIYAISSDPREISYADIKGVVDRYGSMKLQGNVQSSKPKEYTDIAMNFRNLDLEALSGYTAQFAGYKIKQGKLFVDLQYKIEHSKMVGQNALVLKNVQLGEEIEDENVTHLPLGLAIALLEDSEGVIDIELPVEGNVDAPDFKYGKVVLKALGNLIVKAVAAPFKFIGSALGIDTQELEYMEFEYGSAKLLPSELEKLDKLAKIAAKRPKIAFAFVPTYDKKRDSRALKKQLLVHKLLKESQAKSDQDLQNSLSVELLEGEFLKTHSVEELARLRQRLEKKYEQKTLFALNYRKILLISDIKQQKLPEGSMEKLALSRYESVKNYLITQKKIDPKRIVRKEVAQNTNKNTKFVDMKVEITIPK